ncbi:hypothetical protein QR680_016060 [Steinernema hermaphroditum]|uniref:C-type lectin domain-containing protein n=1 Tax=Steinernema hermaphroditum TaxID=289476 RepID=A0AA39LLY7_9BILA|nr:hypothetical protein QR680_016060 [Steinernema hermaphroditum]
MERIVTFFALLIAASAVCPDKWSYYPLTNSCFIYNANALNFTSAQAACVAANKNAALASISSASENTFVVAIASTGRSQTWGGLPWIGGYSSSDDGTPTADLQWQWMDGKPWGYKNWCPQNPNNAWEKCVQILSDNCQICQDQFVLGCWNNNACRFPLPFVCKMPNPA